MDPYRQIWAMPWHPHASLACQPLREVSWVTQGVQLVPLVDRPRSRAHVVGRGITLHAVSPKMGWLLVTPPVVGRIA